MMFLKITFFSMKITFFSTYCLTLQGIATKAFRPVAEVATITTTRGLCRTETRATITVATMAEDNSHIRVDSTWKMTKIKKKIVLSNKSDNTNNEYIRNKYNDVNVDDKNCEV